MDSQQPESSTPPVSPSNETLEASPSRHANYVLAVLLATYTVNFIDRQILSIVLEPVKLELGASDTAMGFLTGIAFALFYVTAGLPIARWADRGTRRSIIALGLAVWSVMTMASGVARTYGQLLVARIGVGVGEAACTPPAHSLIADYFPPERRSTALSVYSLGVPLGVLFGMLAGGWINQFFGWRVAFLVVGLPGVVLALVVRFTIEEPPRGQADGLESPLQPMTIRETLSDLSKMKSFKHLAIAAALHAFVGYGSISWNPAFLMRTHGMETGMIGTWLGLIIGLGGAAGTLLGGILGDRLGRRDSRWYMWIPAISMLIAVPFSVSFYLIPDPRVGLLLLIPATALGSAYHGPVYATVQSLARPEMRAMSSAILLFVINIIGLGLGPQAVGIMSDLLRDRFGDDSLRYALLIVALANIWSGIHYVIASRHLPEDLRRRRESARAAGE